MSFTLYNVKFIPAGQRLKLPPRHGTFEPSRFVAAELWPRNGDTSPSRSGSQPRLNPELSGLDHAHQLSGADLDGLARGCRCPAPPRLRNWPVGMVAVLQVEATASVISACHLPAARGVVTRPRARRAYTDLARAGSEEPTGSSPSPIRRRIVSCRSFSGTQRRIRQEGTI
jgi:hypothetical protein